MLGAQITARLLPEQKSGRLVWGLIRDCDRAAPATNCLVPVHHCLHTPGGPLKFSLEGHQFAVFGFKLTSDGRYVVSVSNKFITFDVTTGDMSRVVYPSLEGLMMMMDSSPNNKYVAAFTNNNQLVILDTISNQYKTGANPLGEDENIQGLVMLEDSLIVYGHITWVVLDVQLNLLSTYTELEIDNSIYIMKIVARSTKHYNIIKWQEGDTSRLKLVTKFYDKEFTLRFHSAFSFNENLSLFFACQDAPTVRICMYDLSKKGWEMVRSSSVPEHPLMLSLISNNSFLVSTFTTGFRLVSASGRIEKVLLLPRGTKNILLSAQKSSPCLLSSDESLAVTGLRRDLYIWATGSCQLVKTLQAHSGRILQLVPLNTAGLNCVITSSVDKVGKYHFQKMCKIYCDSLVILHSFK